MSKTRINSILVLLISILSLSCGSKQQSGTVSIDAGKLKELNSEDVILLDVRTPGEFEQGRIANSILINYRDEEFKELVMKLDTEKPVIVYCAAGGRSTGASKILEEVGFKTIYNYTGGFNDWKSRGEKIEN